MTTDRFADRLDARTYADDGVVGVFVELPSEPDAVWLPERVFMRLTFVARGYELHYLPLLGGSEPIVLEEAQCQTLLDELEFVATRLNDPMAVAAAQTVADYVAANLAKPGPTHVTFEGE